MKHAVGLVVLSVLAGCGSGGAGMGISPGISQGTGGEAEAFLAGLGELCGRTLTGAVVEDDTNDPVWGGAEIVVGPVACMKDRIAMPLAVGDDTSRTWIVTPDPERLVLKHRHLLGDGSVDPVSNYGGTADPARGTAVRQVFPVDAESVATFEANGLTASVTNRWVLEVLPGNNGSGSGLAYELRRPATDVAAERVFRVEVRED